MPNEPIAHLVWLQGRRGADDVEDYYEVARPGDKSVDGSDPFPVYAGPVPPIVENFIKIPTIADEAEAMEKMGFAWLREHAPERLTPEGLARPIPASPPAAMQESAGIKALTILDPADDEAMEWITETGLCGVRHDDGSIEYGLAAVIRAFQAGKSRSTASPQAGGKAHIDPDLEPGEYIVTIATKGGAAQINGPVNPAPEIAALRAAAKQMLGDYQTSDGHHPNHVLVPLAAFNASRAAVDNPSPELVGKAAEIIMGRGLVDVSEISFDGRKGILFRPRSEHIPVGQEGQLPEGVYWPAKGDVVIWIENEGGARVIEKYLRAFLPSASEIAALRAENERLREALWPFAKVAEKDIGETEDEADLFVPPHAHNRAPRLVVGDFRRARAALQQQEEGK